MLIESLRAQLGPEAASFQLMGEDLTLLTGADLAAAAAAYEAEVAVLSPPLRAAFRDEQRRFLGIAHGWLRRYNVSIYSRIRGYLALAALCDFEFPWPVVAVLGLCQVLDGLVRWKAYGVIGRLARRLDGGRLDELALAMDDVLLRTNRGIFADSVPPVLLALHAHTLASRGEAALCHALQTGPQPLLWDQENRALVAALGEALATPDGTERFHRLAALTLQQFGREQAIFTHHMGKGASSRDGSSLLRRLLRVRSVPAPIIEAGQLVFRPYPLPAGFVYGDHKARVEHFGRAFVRSVTGTIADYQVAVAYVQARFGAGSQAAAHQPTFPHGGTRAQQLLKV